VGVVLLPAMGFIFEHFDGSMECDLQVGFVDLGSKLGGYGQ
jgi:hypothetical protein